MCALYFTISNDTLSNLSWIEEMQHYFIWRHLICELISSNNVMSINVEQTATWIVTSYGSLPFSIVTAQQQEEYCKNVKNFAFNYLLAIFFEMCLHYHIYLDKNVLIHWGIYVILNKNKNDVASIALSFDNFYCSKSNKINIYAKGQH